MFNAADRIDELLAEQWDSFKEELQLMPAKDRVRIILDLILRRLPKAASNVDEVQNATLPPWMTKV